MDIILDTVIDYVSNLGGVRNALAGGRFAGILFKTDIKLSSYKFPESEITSHWDLEEHLILPSMTFIQGCLFFLKKKTNLKLLADYRGIFVLIIQIREVIVSLQETKP